MSLPCQLSNIENLKCVQTRLLLTASSTNYELLMYKPDHLMVFKLILPVQKKNSAPPYDVKSSSLLSNLFRTTPQLWATVRDWIRCHNCEKIEEIVLKEVNCNFGGNEVVRKCVTWYELGSLGLIYMENWRYQAMRYVVRKILMVPLCQKVQGQTVRLTCLFVDLSS